MDRPPRRPRRHIIATKVRFQERRDGERIGDTGQHIGQHRTFGGQCQNAGAKAGLAVILWRKKIAAGCDQRGQTQHPQIGPDHPVMAMKQVKAEQIGI